MEQEIKIKMIELLKSEVIPALGCTEPIAVALAAAKAKSVLDSDIDKIEVFVSPNIMKNGMGVGIPGTHGLTGLDIAAALGVTGGKHEAELQVLQDITLNDVQKALDLVKNNVVEVKLKRNSEKLYIEVIIYNKNKDFAKVIIQGKHNNISYISKNNEVIFEKANNSTEVFSEKEKKLAINLEIIYEFIENINADELTFLLEGAEMNKKVAFEGLENEYGLKVGRTIMENVKNNILCDSIQTYAMALTAAACDARMAGCKLPVMSNSGSGNQGLVVILPVVATAEKLKVEKEKFIKALALSHLIAIYIKSFLGRLSAICGCTVAAAGSGSGITYLLGGDLKAVKATIKNMIGNVSGMICDGAKAGCALKVSTGVSAAIQSSLLALKGIEVSGKDGINHECVEKTIQNLVDIAINGMTKTDECILDIMISK